MRPVGVCDLEIKNQNENQKNGKNQNRNMGTEGVGGVADYYEACLTSI